MIAIQFEACCNRFEFDILLCVSFVMQCKLENMLTKNLKMKIKQKINKSGLKLKGRKSCLNFQSSSYFEE